MKGVDRPVVSAVQLVFDTNILVDVLLARGPYYHYGVQVLDMVRAGKVEGWYAPHSVTTVYYLVERTLAGEAISRKEAVSVARDLVKKILGILKPLPQVGDELLHLSLDPGDDLEDQLIVKLAVGYLPNPLIVTRDKWFLQQKACRAAHPKEITESGLDPWLPGGSAPMQFIDLASQQRALRLQIQAAVHRVLHHGQYIMGPEIKELEEKLSAFVEARHAITCASGTDALLIALMALDIGPGDEIITVPYTWISSAEVIALLRAKPVFVDIQPDTFNMDPDRIEAAITTRTKAIMPVSIYGQCADMTRINGIARKHGIPVIEDGAQSFGATHHGKKSCALSLIGCTSFFPSKPLGCYGDGGAVFTDDDALAEKMLQIRVHGQKVKHEHPIIGINGRLDTMQAAILL
jgi:predicted nucleic acid-binding protein